MQNITHHGTNSFRLTLCLARRLNLAVAEAKRQWAVYKRDIGDRETLERYTRQLKRCDKLSAALEGRAAL